MEKEILVMGQSADMLVIAVHVDGNMEIVSKNVSNVSAQF